MKKLLLLIALLMAACTGTPVVSVPTLAVLPSATPSSTWTSTPLPSSTSLPTLTPSPTLTATPTDTTTLQPSASFTLTPSVTFTPSETDTNTPLPSSTYTLTPSLTITDTITPTPSPSFTASPELDGLGLLALLSERATILPPQMLYNPQTLTAVAYAGQTLVAAGSQQPASNPATPLSGTPDFQLATLAPPQTTTCSSAPPGNLGAVFAADPSLTQAVGCPQGSQFSTTTAVEAFEHGSMIYVQGSPNSIYVLTIDGRFARYDDTWVDGVDPVSGNETPPTGLVEPKRGFGKVWRNNLQVRGSLGWAIDDEQGAAGSSVQLFERGIAVFLPQRGQTTLLINDPGGTTGAWRTLPTSF